METLVPIHFQYISTGISKSSDAKGGLLRWLKLKVYEKLLSTKKTMETSPPENLCEWKDTHQNNEEKTCYILFISNIYIRTPWLHLQDIKMGLIFRLNAWHLQSVHLWGWKRARPFQEIPTTIRATFTCKTLKKTLMAKRWTFCLQKSYWTQHISEHISKQSSLNFHVIHIPFY